MNFNDKTKKIVCAVLAIAICLPIAIGIISMFTM